MKPKNAKEANKDAKIYVGRTTTVHNLLFCIHKFMHELYNQKIYIGKYLSQ